MNNARIILVHHSYTRIILHYAILTSVGLPWMHQKTLRRKSIIRKCNLGIHGVCIIFVKKNPFVALFVGVEFRKILKRVLKLGGIVWDCNLDLEIKVRF